MATKSKFSAINDPSMLAEIRRIHFSAKRLATQSVGGEYKSAFRGRGIEFEEVREYSIGDDIRSIDWKVTARARKPFVKIFREERELTVILAVDVSGSTNSATRQELRKTLIAQISSVLALVALNNNDKVGLVTFSDKLHQYYPPKRARQSVWRIVSEVMSKKTVGGKTDLAALFTFLASVVKKTAVIFVISDFQDSGFELPLKRLAKKHDVTGIIIRDPSDKALNDVGLITLLDPETGKATLLDTSNPELRAKYEAVASKKREQLQVSLRGSSVGILELYTNTPFINSLRQYFRSRAAVIGH